MTSSTVTKARENHSASEEGMRIIGDTLRLSTDKQLELYNITERVAAAIKRHGVREGLLHLSSLHTTLAIFINEWQPALLDDFKAMLLRVVSPDDGWRHNDPQHSDCDRQNAHSHLQASILGHTLVCNIKDGGLGLGQFQAIIAAELDGPRERELSLQIIGR
jgi:secondary thiamine-phosphate synthase enzyme